MRHFVHGWLALPVSGGLPTPGSGGSAPPTRVQVHIPVGGVHVFVPQWLRSGDRKILQGHLISPAKQHTVLINSVSSNTRVDELDQGFNFLLFSFFSTLEVQKTLNGRLTVVNNLSLPTYFLPLKQTTVLLFFSSPMLKLVNAGNTWATLWMR